MDPTDGKKGFIVKKFYASEIDTLEETWKSMEFNTVKKKTRIISVRSKKAFDKI